MAGRKMKKTFEELYGDLDVGESTKGPDQTSTENKKGEHSGKARSKKVNKPSGADGYVKMFNSAGLSGIGEHLARNLSFNMVNPGGPAPREYQVSHAKANLIDHVERTFKENNGKVVRTETDVMSEPTYICQGCKAYSDLQLKRCARCLAVSYCNKECQTKHFNTHKNFCRLCNRYDIARARVWPALRFYKDLKHDRDYTVLLRDLPTEEDHKKGAWCNLLVEIVGQAEHHFHYSCIVTDLSGQRTVIIFHDPNNEYRHPLYNAPGPIKMNIGSELKPGNFLLIMGTHWRHFNDGMLGIRVNSLDSLYLIMMDDYDPPKEYANHKFAVAWKDLKKFNTGSGWSDVGNK